MNQKLNKIAQFFKYITTKESNRQADFESFIDTDKFDATLDYIVKVIKSCTSSEMLLNTTTWGYGVLIRMLNPIYKNYSVYIEQVKHFDRESVNKIHYAYVDTHKELK